MDCAHLTEASEMGDPFLFPLGENPFKGGVVSGFFKERESPNTAVQDMIGEIVGSLTWSHFRA